MIYFVLGTGPRGMAQRVAIQHMEAARKRCPGVSGWWAMTQPTDKGIYYVVFEANPHGLKFREFLDLPRTQVVYQQLSSLPPGVTLKGAISSLTLDTERALWDLITGDTVSDEMLRDLLGGPPRP